VSGGAAVLAAGCAALAVAAASGRSGADRRLAAILGRPPRRFGGRAGLGKEADRGPGARLRAGVPAGVPAPPGAAARMGLALSTAACGYVLGGPSGAVLAALAAVLLDRRLLAATSRAERRRKARLRADLPGAAELLAACLAAGAAPADAADAVAAAVRGPVGDALRRVVALLRLGGDPASCWLGLASDPELAAIGRAVARAVEAGTSLAPVVAAEAASCRADGRLAAQSAIARLGVHATAPLGLCFLPAFLLLGIVPVVLGLGAGVLAP
jgi:hypothetical protein